MAMPEAVNAQITDAVTQANPRHADGSSAAARATLYMATAHAMGMAAENAVAAQQQQSILQQASTTQGIMQIYALDTATDQASAGADKLANTVQSQSGNLSTETVAQSIDKALDPAGKLATSGDSWPAELREVMFAVAESLHQLQSVSNEYSLTAIKQAAIAAVLARLVRAPELLEPYQKVLEVIKAL